MNSLDTNIIIRYFLNDIPEQTIGVEKFISESACYVTDVVVTEAVFVLERVIGLSRSDITKLFRAFLGLPNIVYNNYFLDQVIDLYAIHKKLSFVDCYASAEAKAYSNKLLSFDKDLVRLGGPHVKLP